MGRVLLPSQHSPCAMCSLKPAVVHCHTDLKRLCESCDASYHSTRPNHARYRICSHCAATTTVWTQGDCVPCPVCDGRVYPNQWTQQSPAGLVYMRPQGSQAGCPFSPLHFFGPPLRRAPFLLLKSVRLRVRFYIGKIDSQWNFNAFELGLEAFLMRIVWLKGQCG